MGQKIAVLGGGISGLCLAFYLKKYAPQDQIVLLEKSSKVGGVIDAVSHGSMIFDQGPKTLRKSTGQDLLELIEQLGLSKKLLVAPSNQPRYIFYQNGLQKLPASFWQMCSSPLTRKSLWAFVKEVFLPACPQKDVSVGDFARKHFGNFCADYIFEPFIRGICGADMEQLSMRCCFPGLLSLEQEYGSIIQGMIKTRKASDKSLFNLQGGLVSLVRALSECGSFRVLYNQHIQSLKQESNQVQVVTQEGVAKYDQVFCTLPLYALQPMLEPSELAKHQVFDKISYESLTAVSCAFEEDVLLQKGFGYLVPKKENQPIYGALFDSCIFPNLDQSHMCKLTMMMPQSSEHVAKELAMSMLKKHLKISAAPAHMHVFHYIKALACYPVHFQEYLEDFLSLLQIQYPKIVLCGNYQHPPGVNYCVKFSKQIAKQHRGVTC